MSTQPNPTPKQPAEDVLRSFPPRPSVRRLRPRVVALLLCTLVLVVVGRLIFKIFDQHVAPAADELRGARLRATDDMLQRNPVGMLPSDYSFLPPPMKAEPPTPPPTQPVEHDEEPEIDPEALKRLEILRKEKLAALDSPIVFEGHRDEHRAPRTTHPSLNADTTIPSDEIFAYSSDQLARSDAHNRRFLRDAANVKTRVNASLQPPRSPYELKAGAIIPAALVTAINSDLPGDVIGQVTANVYDSVSGRYLLVPQGTRMIGKYNSEVLNGQNRVLIAWQRLIFPNGYSIVLEAMPGTDAAGVSGMADQVDYHASQLANATLWSTLVALAGNFAGNVNRDQQELAITANTVTQQSARVAQRIIDRELNIKPTILIRAGMPLNVLVNRDLPLAPYEQLGLRHRGINRIGRIGR